jgi:hypothetical protein
MSEHEDQESATLQSLQPKMTKALHLRQAGKDDAALKVLREILAAEPRLAEPRLELAHIAALREDWAEAELQATEAIRALRAGGQWTTEVDPRSLLSFALNLLGEIVVRPLEEGDLFLTDRPRFVRTWNRASVLFGEASKLDPDNEDARRNLTRYAPLEG